MFVRPDVGHISPDGRFTQPLSRIGQSRGTTNDLPTLPASQHFSRTKQTDNEQKCGANVVLGKFSAFFLISHISYIFVRLSCLRSSNSFLYYTKTWNRVSDVVKATSKRV